MGSVAPAKPGHAIQKIAFIVEFDGPIDSGAIRAADAIYPEFKEELPRRALGQGLFIQFGVGPAPGPGPMPDLASVTYERLAPDGEPIRGLKLEGNTLQVLRGDYDRWGATWPEVRALMSKILPVCLNGRSVAGFSIQYLDQFIYSGAYDEFRPAMVLSEKSPFVAPHVFGRSLNWHSHTGFFEIVKEPAHYRRLDVINIDLIDFDQSRKMIQITSTHTAQLPGPMRDEILKGDVNGVLNTYMRSLHDANKVTLKAILNDEMLAKVGLAG